MEPKELSPALLHPPVTVVATLGELIATLPTAQDEALLESPGRLYRGLEKFTEKLQATLNRIDDTWRHHTVTSDDDDPVTSLSRALAAYKSTPGTTWDDVALAASKWQWSVSVLVDSWAWLARKATKLCDTCRDLATKAADVVATARASELQEEAAAEEPMMELGQALGGEEGAEVVARREAQVREQARVAASWATMATMVRQRVEAALGLLERLEAACDEAAAFPRALQRLFRDIEATLKGTKKFPDVLEELVAKVAEAERLWEANAHLVKDHLLEAVNYIIRFFSERGRASPSAHEVAERCQRAIQDIPRLLRPLQRPQGVPKVSTVSMETKEVSPALLYPPVTVVATLDELLDTLPRQDEETLLKSQKRLHRGLEKFTKELRATLHCIDDTWKSQDVTSDDDDPVTSLSRALAAYKRTSQTTWDDVALAASKWQWSVSVLVDSWAWLARKATKLCDTCRDLATKAADVVATARASELQEEAAAEEPMMELGQALGGEEGAEVVAGREAQVREQARVAASWATMATMVRQRLEAALGLLERLEAACDKATAFPWALQRLLRDIETALEGTKKKFPDVLDELVAKVAKAEQLWEASAHLARDHLLGIIDDIILEYYSESGRASPSAHEVAERCQRAIQDIPRLLRPLQRPQGVPKVSTVSMEPKEVSPALLYPPVTVVAIVGKLLDTLPRQEEEMLLESQKRLHRGLEKFTKELRATLHCIDDTWKSQDVTSLSQALAAYKRTPQTTQDDVTMVASKWKASVATLVDSWAQLARAATKLRSTCREGVREAFNRVATATARASELQEEAARYGTALENMGELGQALGGEEEAEVVAGREAQVREQARVAASWATRATMVRQRVEGALGLLECLVAECHEATAFPLELQHLLTDTETALVGTKKKFPDVPEELVAKVAKAEQFWEANTRLAKDHLLGIIDDLIIEFYSESGRARPSACEVAERCQRAIKEIPNLLQG